MCIRDRAIDMMQDCSLYIDDTGSITPMTLRSRARRMKRETGIDMIVLDYLQLMTLPEKSENRVNEIASITRQLKSLAKDLQINPKVSINWARHSMAAQIMDSGIPSYILSDYFGHSSVSVTEGYLNSINVEFEDQIQKAKKI